MFDVYFQTSPGDLAAELDRRLARIQQLVEDLDSETWTSELVRRLTRTAERLERIAESPKSPCPPPARKSPMSNAHGKSGGHVPKKAVPPEVTDLLNRIDAATTAAGSKITELRDQIKAGMSQADVDQIKTRLTAVADGLEAMAKDPEDPVPTP